MKLNLLKEKKIMLFSDKCFYFYIKDTISNLNYRSKNYSLSDLIKDNLSYKSSSICFDYLDNVPEDLLKYKYNHYIDLVIITKSGNYVVSPVDTLDKHFIILDKILIIDGEIQGHSYIVDILKLCSLSKIISKYVTINSNSDSYTINSHKESLISFKDNFYYSTVDIKNYDLNDAKQINFLPVSTRRGTNSTLLFKETREE